MKNKLISIISIIFILTSLLTSCKKNSARDIYDNPIKVIETIDQSGNLFFTELLLQRYLKSKKISQKKFNHYSNGIKQRRVKAVEALENTKVKIKVGHYPMANFKYHFQEGYLCDVLRLDKEAMIAYNKAISLKATNSFAHVKRGLVWERLGNKEKAFDDIMKGYTLSSRDPFANFHLGHFYIRQGKLKLVKKYIESLKNKWPNFSATLEVLLKEKVKKNG